LSILGFILTGDKLKVETTQNSFVGGEFAPALMGRTDIAQYANACTTLENLLVRPNGAVKTTPGTEYVNDAKYTVVPVQSEYTADSGTVFLAHMDSDFFDSSAHTHGTGSLAWSATTSTTKFKFGGCSGYFPGPVGPSNPFAGAYVDYPDSLDWTILTGGLRTYDFWVNLASLPGLSEEMTLFSHREDSSKGYYFYIYNFNGDYRWGFQTNAFPAYSGGFTQTGATINLNQWYHIALTFAPSSGTSKLQTKFFIDGVLTKTAGIETNCFSNVSAPFRLGAQWLISYNSYLTLKGYLDEFRISDTLRWTTTFTPGEGGTVDVYGKSKLNPFIFSRTDSYVIETGENYFRFYTNGGVVNT